MGKLISLFSGEPNSTLGIIIDFENAQPVSDEEKKIYAEVAEYLNASEKILKEIAEFKGCDEVIRKAITTPGAESEKAAWDAIVPSVDILKNFYDFSVDLEQILPKLLINLFSNDKAQTNIQGQQALAKQLANILDFVLRFDDAKMVNPAIQNDFSYYRRSLSKHKNKVEVKIKDELANRMSLFFAYPTPMLKVITDTTLDLVKKNTIAKLDVVTGFTLFANVCLELVETGHFTNSTTNTFCLRAMTASIVLVDHIDDIGAFHKKTEVRVKNAVGQLNRFKDPNDPGCTECLLNALRFSTVHLNDPTTPEIVKSMLS